MKMLRKITILLLVMMTSLSAFTQGQTPATNDLMRSNGRIYVVVAVVLTILIGLLLYVFRLDRKMTRLEKDNSGQ